MYIFVSLAEGVESRGFTYTASDVCPPPRPRSLPPVPSSSSAAPSNPSSGHYSTLQNYGSVIPANDPRFSQFMVDNKLARQHVVSLP